MGEINWCPPNSPNPISPNGSWVRGLGIGVRVRGRVRVRIGQNRIGKMGQNRLIRGGVGKSGVLEHKSGNIPETRKDRGLGSAIARGYPIAMAP